MMSLLLHQWFDVGYNKSNKIVPQTNWIIKKTLVTSFDLSYNFDENSLFYFLGIEGARKYGKTHAI